MTKEQKVAKSKKYRKAHPERTAETDANSRLKRRYGISLFDKKRMEANQKGKCALCERPLPTKSFNRVIDHDHLTGRVRGVICRACNVALARFGDNGSAITKLVKYLFPTHYLNQAFDFGDE